MFLCSLAHIQCAVCAPKRHAQIQTKLSTSLRTINRCFQNHRSHQLTVRSPLPPPTPPPHFEYIVVSFTTNCYSGVDTRQISPPHAQGKYCSNARLSSEQGNDANDIETNVFSPDQQAIIEHTSSSSSPALVRAHVAHVNCTRLPDAERQPHARALARLAVFVSKYICARRHESLLFTLYTHVAYLYVCEREFMRVNK